MPGNQRRFGWFLREILCRNMPLPLENSYAHPSDMCAFSVIILDIIQLDISDATENLVERNADFSNSRN